MNQTSKIFCSVVDNVVVVLGKLHAVVKEETLSESLRNFAINLRNMGLQWRATGALPNEDADKMEAMRLFSNEY
jgi:hypothetical protein